MNGKSKCYFCTAVTVFVKFLHGFAAAEIKITECFQALQKQELLAATHRISNLCGEVRKLKDLERILQKRYGDLLQEQERVQNLIDAYLQAKIQEEISAKNCACEMAEAEAAMIKLCDGERTTPHCAASVTLPSLSRLSLRDIQSQQSSTPPSGAT
ncbi:Reverse transcriptase domain-containing protein [Forsythia ovata]|uniref:Reverse transcriptase domain-containing protein n=1 Tax=Forsythia ovata TaxID=205694 RepID=A0ABD1P419_9LAMI